MVDDDYGCGQDYRPAYLAPDLIPQHALSGGIEIIDAVWHRQESGQPGYEPDHR